MTDLKKTMALVSELNHSHGVTQRGGKKYTQVVHRMEAFRQMHGTEYGVDTSILVDDAQRVVVKATIHNMDGTIVGSGMAEEIRGQGNVNKTSALENCETSAIGRALASLGLAGGEYASVDEIDAAHRKHDTINENIIELQRQAEVFLPEFDQKGFNDWMNSEFTKKWMQVAGREHPDIYQEIKTACQDKNKEFKKNG
ncbi:MAG: hypothetical protein CMF11_09705 [Idiomarina sp.]|nr:hypothetical protein [Idiomarina sp.]